MWALRSFCCLICRAVVFRKYYFNVDRAYEAVLKFRILKKTTVKYRTTTKITDFAHTPRTPAIDLYRYKMIGLLLSSIPTRVKNSLKKNLHAHFQNDHIIN